MFKKLLFIVPLVILFMAGCKKSSSNGCQFTESTLVAPAAEIANLQTYITANHPAAIQHSSGIFYEIVTPGTGATASICSSVGVRYAGYLTNGSKFDESTTTITFPLGQLIVGWQKGIPLIKSGGSINLYIPPSLGYGNRAVGTIPANSNLVFVIQLDAVQ